MNDTDRLIAAIFATRLAETQGVPKLEDLFAHYDSCIRKLQDREKAVLAASVETWDPGKR